MRTNYVFWVALFITSTAFAQPPDSLWSRTFGGGSPEYCYAVRQTSDNGFVLAGRTDSFGAGDGDFWLIKTNTSGDAQWSRTYGGNQYDECRAIQQTTDGGYILAGWTDSFGADNLDFWLVKTNANGDSLWSRTFGGGANDMCYAVEQTTDGGYILAGFTFSFGAGAGDFWLVKTNQSGILQWSRTFGGAFQTDYGWAVTQTADGGYAIAGHTQSFGSGAYDFWMVKTNTTGDSLWSRTFGGGSHDYATAIEQTADGGYMLAGYTYSFGAGNLDCWMVKTNSNGDSLWSRTFGGGSEDWCYAAHQTSDGGYVVAGSTYSYGSGQWDFWLIKTDENGDTLWSRTFGGNLYDEGRAVLQTTDGSYILVGYTLSFGAGSADFWLVKTGTVPPEAPESLTVYRTGETLRFRWIPSSGAAEYQLLSATTPDGPFDTVEGTTTNTQLELPLPASLKLFYVVVANSSSGPSSRESAPVGAR